MSSKSISMDFNSGDQVEFLFFTGPSRVLFSLAGKFLRIGEKKKNSIWSLATLQRLYNYSLNIAIIALCLGKLFLDPSRYGASISTEVFSLSIEIWYIGAMLSSAVHLYTSELRYKLLNSLYVLHKKVNLAVNYSDVMKQNRSITTISWLFFVHVVLVSAVTFLCLNYSNISMIRSVVRAMVIFHYVITANYIYFFQVVLCRLLDNLREQLSTTAENVKSILEMFIQLQVINDDFNCLYWIQTLVIIAVSIIPLLKFGFIMGCEIVFGGYNEFRPSDYFWLVVQVILIMLLCSIGTIKYCKATALYKKVLLATIESSGQLAYYGGHLMSAISDVPLHFSGGLFYINMSFLVNIAGIVVTYWVILLEFEMAYNSSKTVEGFLRQLNITGM